MIDFLFEDSLDDGTMTLRCELILRPRGTISLILEGCSDINKLAWFTFHVWTWLCTSGELRALDIRNAEK
jgi:hypothetical protein